MYFFRMFWCFLVDCVSVCMFDKHVRAKSNFQPFCKISEVKCCHLPTD